LISLSVVAKTPYTITASTHPYNWYLLPNQPGDCFLDFPVTF